MIKIDKKIVVLTSKSPDNFIEIYKKDKNGKWALENSKKFPINSYDLQTNYENIKFIKHNNNSLLYLKAKNRDDNKKREWSINFKNFQIKEEVLK